MRIGKWLKYFLSSFAAYPSYGRQNLWNILDGICLECYYFLRWNLFLNISLCVFPSFLFWGCHQWIHYQWIHQDHSIKTVMSKKKVNQLKNLSSRCHTGNFWSEAYLVNIWTHLLRTTSAGTWDLLWVILIYVSCSNCFHLFYWQFSL